MKSDNFYQIMIVNVSSVPPNLLPKKKNRRAFSVRNIWRLRYRVYALIVVLVLVFFLHSGEKDIPENISVSGFGYYISQENVLASKVDRKNDTFAFGDSIDLKVEPVEAQTIIINGEKVTFYDKTGRIITEKLKRDAGFDLGFIFSQPFVDLGVPISITSEELKEFEDSVVANEIKDDTPKSLDELIPPTTGSSQFRNLLMYDKYKIRVPLIYTSFTDVFNTNPDGSINFGSARDASSVDSPVQRKLQDGIVHLAYTPQPGELGNSYIIGHSSNYSYVQSRYNSVFKPIEQRSQPGEEFVIYDRYGRELRFRVFEAIKISDSDVAKAYEKFPDKRVVTLQTSILGIRNGRWEATHRWLTRGELVI